MISSMTGFGNSKAIFKTKKIVVEIKSLNSKTLDLNFRIPSIYKPKEIELRKYFTTKLGRGKADLLIYFDNATLESIPKINKELAISYHKELKKLALDLGINSNIDMSLLLRMPNIMKEQENNMEEVAWEEVLFCVEEACAKLIEFRKAEGSNLERDLIKRIKIIGLKLSDIGNSDSQRISIIKKRIHQGLEDAVGKSNIDANRFEQELIFYLEKLDITEEKVRLKTHLDYFSEVMEKEKMQGKKLAFITQEIGREINTIGSKANDATIQKMVVEMKDELEKIKEQILNIV